MSDDPLVVDAADVKKIVLPCNCAAVLIPGANDDKGVSFYFCATHAQGEVAVVYDVTIEIVHPPFAWDYSRNPS